MPSSAHRNRRRGVDVAWGKSRGRWQSSDLKSSKLCLASTDNFRLGANSPAIDAADASLVPAKELGDGSTFAGAGLESAPAPSGH
jgi:hypothetical protein